MTTTASEMEKVRAVRQLGGQDWDAYGKMFAFLSIFHPEISLAKRLSLARDALAKSEAEL